MMSNARYMVLGLTAVVLYSCGDPKKEAGTGDELPDPDTAKTAVLNVAGELFSVPSPVQTAMLIQKAGVAYEKGILNPANRMNTYPSDYFRALNLGIYGADLGYVSMYNQTQDAIGYLASVKHLADKLGVSAAFDQQTMERINKNIANKDSMMVLVGIAYRASDSYLKTNKRAEVSSLILAGGWLESMNFSVNAYSQKQIDEIKFRIADQKQALGSIIKLLNSHNMPEATTLAKDLEDLKTVYEGVSSKYTYVEPTTDEAKKVTYINSTTEVNITKEQIEQISTKIKAIREKIVNGQS